MPDVSPAIPPPSVRPAPRWRVVVSASSEPLLLARVLQKFTVPEIALCTVAYDAGAPDRAARIELSVQCSPERARLAALRTRKIFGVGTVLWTARPT